MEYVLLGWPPGGPTLRLDHRRFAYAGKFVVSNTGKAVVRPEGDEADGVGADEGPSTAPDGAEYDTDILAAVAFDADRTDDRTLRFRYITVRSDLQGEGVGPRLATFVAAKAEQRGYDRIAIAVNNPFAYEAMYKAGFAWTGRESGLAELVLERPAGPIDDTGSTPDPGTYHGGLERFRERDFGEPEASFVAGKVGSDPPARVAVPDGVDRTDPDA
ncbi:GNAT family N-acetyltransferase [Halobellus ruber]|uniref:GNAT family N-acetyltransferase n=1 Tax=Halobellus ruber TaxID=2761102 RepID=A0A7J9SH33_9EURY|nr:GNAT family N-acetyltransferase [Halobellus ruber]MBB6646274.1 GNAT family N-acetyltransferase [Halobellus ruber]